MCGIMWSKWRKTIFSWFFFFLLQVIIIFFTLSSRSIKLVLFLFWFNLAAFFLPDIFCKIIQFIIVIVNMIRRPWRFPWILAKTEMDRSATKNFTFIGYISAIIILILGSTGILLQIYSEPTLIGVPSKTYSNILSYCNKSCGGYFWLPFHIVAQFRFASKAN